MSSLGKRHRFIPSYTLRGHGCCMIRASGSIHVVGLAESVSILKIVHLVLAHFKGVLKVKFILGIFLHLRMPIPMRF